jgi:hypothetical protein
LNWFDSSVAPQAPLLARAHRIQVRMTRPIPSAEILGCGKCDHRKRRPFEGDQPVDPERDPPEDE